MKCLYCLFFFFSPVILLAQETDTANANSLSAIEVKAYGQVRKLKDVPAAVGFINRQTLERFSSSSLVQAVNTVAGVRMEERSPGSYRINIRGSSLRSPFGVRNVKVYFNDIPFTDPGGNTYLNGLGYYNFGTLEILKGPGSSLYGAGTGGVLLIESVNATDEANVTGEYTTGSFGLRNLYAAVTTGAADSRNKIGFQHQQSDGYRNHSALRRDVFSWNGNYRVGDNNALKTTFLYSDHFYQTPGALTRAEYKVNRRAARPGGGGFPGAEQAKASINQRTFLAGLSLQQQLTPAITNLSTAYGMFTELRNPAIRNYGKVTEPHAGGRTVFTGRKQWGETILSLSAGGEWQQNFSTSSVYKNAGGNQDSLQTEDDIRVRQSFAFVQASISHETWELTAGTSFNGSKLLFRRLVPRPLPQQERNLNNGITPRLAIARKFQAFTVYTTIAKGFSPPTTAELLPSGSSVNLSLQAEEGTNYDIGFRASPVKDLTIDVNAFYFRLKNTIVQRRDAGGGDFFINAGKTSQKGLESSLQYAFFRNTPFLRQASFWLSHTYHHFRYKDFKQVTADFSGKALPGIAPHVVSSGLEAFARNGLLLNVTYYYNSRIPLNDANTEYADAFHLLGTKIGYEKIFRSGQRVKILAGADNLLDQSYSLGNDINAFGGRYFNAAAGRNYYASFIIRLFTAQKNPPLPEGL